MLDLHRIQALILFLSLFAVSNISGQTYDRHSNNYYQFAKKPFYFGLSLGIDNTKYKIVNNNSLILSDSFQVVESSGTSGFHVGLITNFKLGEDVDFRLIPTFTFADRNLQYTNRDGTVDDNRLETIYTEIPLIIRYKSRPFHDKRVYLLGGFKYGFDISNKSRTRNQDAVIKLAESDFSIEYGAGLQFFMKYFILSPEFKVSHSLSNNLIYDDTKERSAVIDKLLLRSFIISFHFEG